MAQSEFSRIQLRGVAHGLVKRSSSLRFALDDLPRSHYLRVSEVFLSWVRGRCVHSRGWLALLPIVFASVGCIATDGNEASSWTKQFHNPGLAADNVMLRIAVVERPVGDTFLDRGVWQHTDEMIGEFDERLVRAENGFRIGHIVGPPPGELQRLLLSDATVAKLRVFAVGKTIDIHLSGEHPEASFAIVKNKKRSDVTLEKARYCFEIGARFDEFGRTVLAFCPKVETGDVVLPFLAKPDRSMWELNREKACKRYPELSWEVTLDSNQTVIVGGRVERDRAIGQQAFIDGADTGGSQRLLVICNCRPPQVSLPQPVNDDERTRINSAPPPLALQAGTSGTPRR